MSLSPQQQAAVDYIGTPTLVVAGAGSGKTRTLTAKIDHLVRSGYDPERILAITFTNKAAEEMKRRLTRLTGEPIYRFPWVRTYHSACLRILKAHCKTLGYDPPVQIFAVHQQKKLIQDILVEMNYDKKHAPAVQAGISNAKNTGDPLGYFDRRPRAFRVPLPDVFGRYEKALKAANAVDFDNILFMTRNLLRDHPEIRNRYQELFQFILCDEYQDTNDLNEEITGLLMKNGNLFAVGDDWQSIYSFRMSNVDHFLSFSRKYPDARIFRLEQNFRSVDEIVQVANALIAENQRKMEKRCFSELQGGVIEIHEFYTDREEADWTARKIESLHGMGIPLNSMAVLYRTKFCSLSFEQSFRKFGIPYRMLGGKGFFERREILDLNAYLAAAVFDKDDASFERIVNVPKRGIGPGTVKKLNGMREGGMSLQGAVLKALEKKVLTPKIYNGLKGVMDLLADIRSMPPDDALREVVARTDYMEYMHGYSSGDSDVIARRENIEQLLYAAARQETLVDYLEEAALIREDRDEEEEDGPGGVNLSTVHAAKGLEFNVVFVVACEESLFPHWRSMESPAELEEERRLMYVSMTRSERYLYLSSAGSRKGNYNRRSRFLDEVEALLSP
jgi:DNA helicase II / ATP-dependent DNA helicase PcrA